MSIHEDRDLALGLPISLKAGNANILAKGNCPLCSDKRGRFFILWDNKNNNSGIFCHNCLEARGSFKHFVKNHYPDYYKDSHFHRFLSRYNEDSFDETLIKEHIKRKKLRSKQKEKPIHSIVLTELYPEHKALEYIKNRQIPKKHWDNLFYCSDFKKLAKHYGYDTNRWKNETDRLVIPFWNKEGIMTHIQGRALSKDTRIRYMTIDIVKDSLKIWGLYDLDLSKPVYIFEGPLDAMFMDNSVAMAGSSVKFDGIFVYDNEPDNKEIRKAIKKKIINGFPVVLWDRDIKEKDLNDMILNGFDVNRITGMVYRGATARMKFRNWR